MSVNFQSYIFVTLLLASPEIIIDRIFGRINKNVKNQSMFKSCEWKATFSKKSLLHHNDKVTSQQLLTIKLTKRYYSYLIWNHCNFAYLKSIKVLLEFIFYINNIILRSFIMLKSVILKFICHF